MDRTQGFDGVAGAGSLFLVCLQQRFDAPTPFAFGFVSRQAVHVHHSEKAVSVACGGWHTAVVGMNGGVWMCGRGEFGRLGLGDQKSQVYACLSLPLCLDLCLDIFLSECLAVLSCVLMHVSLVCRRISVLVYVTCVPMP